jgi:hypothetical protein
MNWQADESAAICLYSLKWTFIQEITTPHAGSLNRI